MELAILQIRAKRILREYPAAVWHEFYSPILNRGQIISFGLAVAATSLVIQRGTAEQVDAELSSWFFAVRAFGVVVVLWAIVSLLRAPLLVVKRESELGAFHGTRFIYHEPYLVKLLRCRPTGKTEYYEFKWKHAEPGSYVKFEIDLEGGAPAKIKYGLYSKVVHGLLPVANWPGTGGMSLERDNRTLFAIEMEPESLSTPVRI